MGLVHVRDHCVRLAVADGWCWFVMREQYFWLVGWQVKRTQRNDLDRGYYFGFCSSVRLLDEGVQYVFVCFGVWKISVVSNSLVILFQTNFNVVGLGGIGVRIQTCIQPNARPTTGGNFFPVRPNFELPLALENDAFTRGLKVMLCLFVPLLPANHFHSFVE